MQATPKIENNTNKFIQTSELKKSSSSNNKYSTNKFKQQKNQIQQTKNHDLIKAKNTYDVHSTSDSLDFTIANFATTNVNNHNNKLDKVNEKHNKYTDRRKQIKIKN